MVLAVFRTNKDGYSGVGAGLRKWWDL